MSSVKGTLAVKVEKTQRGLIGARVKIRLLTEQITTHKLSAEEMELLENDV